jgi:hypothetical protein
LAQLEHIEAIEKRLWSAADNLRANSNYASNEYFLPVMGLVFLRHAYSRYLTVKARIEPNLPSRGGRTRALSEVLRLLKDLPQAIVASDEEVLFFIERNTLMGRGIGYVDAHLLAAVTLGGSTRLWTRDKRLRSVAEALNLAYGED